MVTQSLLARGDAVRLAQRSRPADLPERITFTQCDVLQPGVVQQAVKGATQVLLAVSFPYDTRVRRIAWPSTMTNVIEACAEVGARIVVIDNLYQLGP
ncbi:NAD(P)H-binding protein [Rhodopila sp.]|uniref:NAD(P)H-binding protein n=1 Tax=Rhodopila sp. TaxID=2480087 RepID=UPI003D0E0423